MENISSKEPDRYKKELLEKLASKRAVIGIIGLGYVGLPLMLRFSEVGFKVVGIDIDQAKVEALNAGKSYIERIDHDKIRTALSRGFEATFDFSRAEEADVLIICVPTPLNKNREPDLGFVIKTTEALLPFLRKGQVLSLESTTYPGTTEEELLPRMESTGLEVGTDVFLVYSPEREDPGNTDFETKTIPKVCGGYTASCLEVGIALYQSAIDRVVSVSSTKAAEMTKLLENIHRAVNIGLINEMKIVADKMDIDIHEVIAAAATKPFGFTPYYPGPGLGGHCIPIDPFYLAWKAKEYDLNARFIELAGEVNTSMPYWVMGKVVEALNRFGKAVNGSKVLVLGISYKPDVDDMRESPSVKLMELLQEKGAEIAYSDPHVPVFPTIREHYFNLSSVELSPEVIREFDCLLVATNHKAFDYEMIEQHARLIVDTRGVYKNRSDKLVKA